MKLYHISQTQNRDYDTYDSAIVAAPDEETARHILPSILISFGDSSWCSSPDEVDVTEIGKALKGTKQGVILASFNAG